MHDLFWQIISLVLYAWCFICSFLFFVGIEVAKDERRGSLGEAFSYGLSGIAFLFFGVAFFILARYQLHMPTINKIGVGAAIFVSSYAAFVLLLGYLSSKRVRDMRRWEANAANLSLCEARSLINKTVDGYLLTDNSVDCLEDRTRLLTREEFEAVVEKLDCGPIMEYDGRGTSVADVLNVLRYPDKCFWPCDAKHFGWECSFCREFDVVIAFY